MTPPVLIGNAYSISIVLLNTWPVCKTDVTDSFPAFVQIF